MAQLEIKPHAEPGERLRFEMLLAEISTFFINLPADRIDSEIEAAQRRVCEFLDLDRSALFQKSEGEPDSLLLTHVHQPPGSRPPPERMNAKDFWPWTLQKIMEGETLTISKLTDLPVEADRDRESFILYGARSVVVVPLLVEKGNVVGLLTFTVMREERDWPKTTVQQFKLVAQIFANALVRREMENRLREQLEEIQRMKLQLEQENIYLREEIELQHLHTEIVSRSQAMKQVLALVEQVAGTDATVLLQGETGTGKELMARSVHRLSARKDRPLVTVNCAALPPTLIESELFGRDAAHAGRKRAFRP
jgi:transcriptional regulator with GAF, ATPase, and Fis domain